MSMDALTALGRASFSAAVISMSVTPLQAFYRGRMVVFYSDRMGLSRGKFLIFWFLIQPFSSKELMAPYRVPGPSRTRPPVISSTSWMMP